LSNFQKKRELMLPKFNKHHIVWIAAIIIAILYIFAPNSAITLLLRQSFHVVLAFLLSILG
jgi:hypothetical protein